MVILGTIREGWGNWSYSSGNCNLRHILLTFPPALLGTKLEILIQINHLIKKIPKDIYEKTAICYQRFIPFTGHGQFDYVSTFPLVLFIFFTVLISLVILPHISISFRFTIFSLLSSNLTFLLLHQVAPRMRIYEHIPSEILPYVLLLRLFLLFCLKILLFTPDSCLKPKNNSSGVTFLFFRLQECISHPFTYRS